MDESKLKTITSKLTFYLRPTFTSCDATQRHTYTEPKAISFVLQVRENMVKTQKFAQIASLILILWQIYITTNINTTELVTHDFQPSHSEKC